MPEWERVRLGDVLTLQRRWVSVDPDQQYREIGIRSFGKGIFHKPSMSGLALGNKRVLEIHPGDLVFSNVFAWEGAVALASENDRGRIGSHRYVTYTVDTSVASSDFLLLYFRTDDGLHLLNSVSPGSAGRNRTLSLERFLQQEIPLPPLPEQRRIVARVKGLLAKVEEMRGLREEIELTYKSFLNGRFQEAIEGCLYSQLGEVAPNVKRSVDLGGRKFREVGARSFGKGLFFKPDFDGAQATWQKPVWIKQGDLVLSNIKAWEGAIASARAEHEDVIASHRYITCRPLEGVSDARFLAFYLLTPAGLEQVGAASPGTADRNRTTGTRALSQIVVPVPAFRIQQDFGVLLNIFDDLRAGHQQSQPQVDALPASILARAFAGAL